jgi:hypothetical protein
MGCGDTFVRADNAAKFGLNTISSAGGTGITSKAASYTILAAEYGKAFSNGAAITLTLPVPKVGMRIFIFKAHNSTLTVAASAGTTINGAASFANSTAGDVDIAFLELTGISDTKWVLTGREGTWA